MVSMRVILRFHVDFWAISVSYERTVSLALFITDRPALPDAELQGNTLKNA